MKRIFIIICTIFISSLCFAKVVVIKDEFNGTEYYQTDQVDINTWSIDSEYASQIRYRTANGDNNTIIMDIAIIAPSAVFSLDKILIKYSNNHITTIIPKSISEKVSSTGNNFTYVLSARQSVCFNTSLTKEDIEAIESGGSIIRLEFNDSFFNIKITKKESDKMKTKLKELLNKINK